MAGQAPLIADLFQMLKNGQLDSIVKSIKLHGIPQSTATMTDYLLLQKAIFYKRSKVVKSLLKANCRVHTLPTDSGSTPLALAFNNENKEISSLLMKKGASIYVANNTANTVLHWAARRRSLKMLKVAVNGIINVNLLDNNKKTALQILLEPCNPNSNSPLCGGKDKIEMIKLLLEKNASVHFRSSNGQTALHYLVCLKQEDIIKSVLQKVENVNMCDNQGNTALHICLSTNYKDEEVYKIVKLFIQKGANINIANCKKTTISHIASEKKYLKVMCKLWQYHCDISLQNRNGDTVLHRLLDGSAHLTGHKVFMQLADLMISVASLENIQNQEGKTPVHLAADSYHYEILKKMLPKLRNINVQDFQGETILHMLVRRFSKENSEIIKLLLINKVDVDLKNANGMTAIDLALKIGNEKLLFLMIPHSKNLSQYKFQNRDVAEYAQTLIEQSVSVDAVDKE